MQFSTILTGAALASITSAKPVSVPVPAPQEEYAPYPVMPRPTNETDAALTLEDVLLKIAPTSDSCEDASFPEECATAAEAAPFIETAIRRYGVSGKGQLAGILSLMAFETGDFKFNRNHFPEPGRPGQGTRNMQMIAYNLPYAWSIPETHNQVVQIITTPPSPPASNGTFYIPPPPPLPYNGTLPSWELLSDDQANEVLDLVMPDEYSWASAFWFFASQCEGPERDALASGTVEGLETYLVECVDTGIDDDRIEYWERAVEALENYSVY